MNIRLFQPSDQVRVKELVLGIQNGEFNLGLAEEAQPDLNDVYGFYNEGGFWVAEIQGLVVGTIGLQILNKDIGILRKMFLQKEHRGTPLKIAQELYGVLLTEASRRQLHYLWLDSPGVAKAAHRFYLRNGFTEMDKSQVPKGFVYPELNSKLFRLLLDS